MFDTAEGRWRFQKWLAGGAFCALVVVVYLYFLRLAFATMATMEMVSPCPPFLATEDDQFESLKSAKAPGCSFIQPLIEFSRKHPELGIIGIEETPKSVILYTEVRYRSNCKDSPIPDAKPK